ncbi:DNA polymerase IV [Vibrio stylophorae]|uniref:DNA polymerase IV n=1 Tax=Vibrio stylophorae TaxID=659351 RepID=A0ABM8ZRL4_9VIBR|nr:DNA polymerase IV [Vibrio stylophorae]CAH0532942.1 DNA polymerase IV [Vibrio stylophorae]
MSKQRKIIHIDMDCFYAAVEMRDHPQWRNRPLAVGGKSSQRGVISTCNYEARQFGVRSAMSTAKAMQLCSHLLVVPGRMDVYKQVSQQIHRIFSRYTELIEPLSLDEAYLDVTDCSAFQGSATRIAEAIRQEIQATTQLTASAGVSSLKFVAKIASDLNKPNGLCVIKPDELDAFIAKLPLEKIPGVGKVTIEKLHEHGLYLGQDVRDSDRIELLSRFGKLGQSLWQRAHGIDERPVVNTRTRKSVGVERTLNQNISSRAECELILNQLIPELERRMQRHTQVDQIARQGVKLKFADFQQTTVEHIQASYDPARFYTLLQEALTRQNGREIRLIGVSVGLKDKAAIEQLQFDWA